MQERDQEFLQLINILMQILQSSSGGGGANSEGGGSGGGGSGPIYGVGFGSSTIMILMGVTIFYLKRQLNQIQVQIKLPTIKTQNILTYLYVLCTTSHFSHFCPVLFCPGTSQRTRRRTEEAEQIQQTSK